MANAHITAAFRCGQFKETERLVLLALADAASPGGKTKDGKKLLPHGWCMRKISTLMAAANASRQQTATKALKNLREAGAIKVQYVKRGSPRFFVDLDWLKAHAYTDEQREKFAYPALLKQREAANHENKGGDTAHEPPTSGGRVEDNAKRLTKTTPSVVLKQREAANSIPSLFPSPAEQGEVPTHAAHAPEESSLPSAYAETNQTQTSELRPEPAQQETQIPDDVEESEGVGVSVSPTAPTARPTPDSAPPPPKESEEEPEEAYRPACKPWCSLYDYKNGVCQKCGRACRHQEHPIRPNECKDCGSALELDEHFRWVTATPGEPAAAEAAAE